MCWQYLCPDWTAPTSASFVVQDVLVSLKEKTAQSFSMDIIMLITWSIRITQNDYILKNIPPNIFRCRRKFKDDIALLLHIA
jgi:hypothetical protein